MEFYDNNGNLLNSDNGNLMQWMQNHLYGFNEREDQPEKRSFFYLHKNVLSFPKEREIVSIEYLVQPGKLKHFK